MESRNIGTHSNPAAPAARVGRVLVVCALVLSSVLLSACASRFVYNRLDFLTHYYLANQVTLDDGQSRALQTNLDGFFAWHRRNELPRYASFLDRAANDATRPLSLAQLADGRRTVEGFLQDSVERAAPDAARWLNGLRPEQVDELFANFAQKERKAREENCEPTPAERREKATRKFIDNAEEWTGKLSRPQRDLIARGLATMETDTCAEMASREKTRVEFRVLVDRYRQRPEFAARIAAFLTHAELREDPAYRRARDADRARFLRLLADVNHTLTPEQREHTVAKLREVAGEMRGLAAQSSRT